MRSRVAPEILLGGRVSEKSDIYSLGVVMWELVTQVRQTGCMAHRSGGQVAQLKADTRAECRSVRYEAFSETSGEVSAQARLCLCQRSPEIQL